MEFIVKCIKHRKGALCRKKCTIAARSLAVGYSVMRKDFLLMTVIKIIFAFFPFVSIQLNRLFFERWEELLVGGSKVLWIETVFGALGFIFFTALYRLEVIVYQRFFLQYGSLLEFEKKIKIIVHQKCSEISAEGFLNPNINQHAFEARVAGINIYRIIEILVGTLAAFFGIGSIAGLFLTINSGYLVLIVLAALPVFAEKYMEMLVQRRNQKELAGYERKEKILREAVILPHFYKENKVNDNFSFLINKWKENQKKYNKLDARMDRKKWVIEIIFGLLAVSGHIGGFAVAIIIFVKDRNLANFTASLVAFQSIHTFVCGIMEEYGYFSMFTVLVAPYFDLLDMIQEEKKKDEISPETEKEKRKEVAILNQVSFAYQDKVILEKIGFSIKRGEKIALVGSNGSGKTTLSKILLGIYTPSAGSATVFQGKTAVFQKPGKYPLSLRKNITISGENENSEKLTRIAHLAELEKFEFEKMLGKELGDGDLSGGEWQRVFIARALYKEADFIVLDEPTSAMDVFHKTRIFEALNKELEGKTVVLITHDLAQARLADRIILLDKGRLSGVGTHDKLLAENEVYRMMWQKQTQYYGNSGISSK